MLDFKSKSPRDKAQLLLHLIASLLGGRSEEARTASIGARAERLRVLLGKVKTAAARLYTDEESVLEADEQLLAFRGGACASDGGGGGEEDDGTSERAKVCRDSCGPTLTHCYQI